MRLLLVNGKGKGIILIGLFLSLANVIYMEAILASVNKQYPKAEKFVFCFNKCDAERINAIIDSFNLSILIIDGDIDCDSSEHVPYDDCMILVNYNLSCESPLNDLREIITDLKRIQKMCAKNKKEAR